MIINEVGVRGTIGSGKASSFNLLVLGHLNIAVKHYASILRVHIKLEGSYLDIRDINVVILEEAQELLEVLFCWMVVTTVWPYSLKPETSTLVTAHNR